MTNPQKAKGSAFERDVVAYLRENGWPRAQRRYGAGAAKDTGDVSEVGDRVIEVKNHARISLATFVDEAEAERVNAAAAEAVTIIKRAGKPVERAYVVVELRQWVKAARK